jgi:hypothetical protein
MGGEHIDGVDWPRSPDGARIRNAAERGRWPLGRNQAGRRRRRSGGRRGGFRHAHKARGLGLENPGEAGIAAAGGEKFEGLGSGHVEA